MRLIQKTEAVSTNTFQGNKPPYAILSHTWGPREYTFDDLCLSNGNGRLFEDVEAHSGAGKLRGFVKTASADGYNYSWADTCCIDSRNFTELNEAINSMYKWYSEASVCYVYLEDFEFSEAEKRGLQMKALRFEEVSLDATHKIVLSILTCDQACDVRPLL